MYPTNKERFGGEFMAGYVFNEYICVRQGCSRMGIFPKSIYRHTTRIHIYTLQGNSRMRIFSLSIWMCGCYNIAYGHAVGMFSKTV